MNRWGKSLITTILLAVIVTAGCAGPKTREKSSAPAAAPKPVTHKPMVHTDSHLTVVSMAYPTGDPATSAVSVEKSIPNEVMINKSFTYHIKATNLTTAPLHNVIVSEGLSSNIDVESTSPEGVAREERTYSWELGTLGPKESKTIAVTARATGRTRISNCASITYNSMLCADAVVVAPELVLTKTGPGEVLLCDPIEYTLTVSNGGTGTVHGVKITDELPEGIVATDGRKTVTIDAGSLSAGQTRAYKLTAKASATGEYTNTATADSEGNLDAETAPVTTIVREPVLEITDSGPKRRYLGRRATHEIVVSNSGDGEARDTVVTADLSSNAAFVRASDGGEADGQKVTWRLGTLAAGQSKTLTVTMSTESDGVISTAASAEAFCAASVAASAETAYRGIPAILLEVIDVDDPIEVGENTTYQITATNQGSARDTNVTIVCSLEGNVEFVSTAGASSANAADGSVEFAPLAILKPGEKATWSVVVKALEPGDVRFHVRMTSDNLTRPVQETEATNLYK